MNPNKWMLVNFDCSLLWVRDRFKLTQAMVVDPLYLQHSFSDKAIDYRVNLLFMLLTFHLLLIEYSTGASHLADAFVLSNCGL